MKKPVRVKDIINTEARFNNRKRPAGWLTPTARQLLRTHLNLVKKVMRILPVTRVALEMNRFAFMALENKGIQHWDYRKGLLYGYESLHDAVSEQQGGKCLLCGKKRIEHYHHLIPRYKNGSNTIGNIAGLCECCHDLVHKNIEAAKKLASKKAGMNKKYHALSVLNQIIPYLAEELYRIFGNNFFITNGWDTKWFRDDNHIEKDHDIDAYCIACSTLEGRVILDVPENSFEIKQFRRRDRANIHRQTERIYKLDGKDCGEEPQENVQNKKITRLPSGMKYRLKNMESARLTDEVAAGCYQKHPVLQRIRMDDAGDGVYIPRKAPCNDAAAGRREIPACGRLREEELPVGDCEVISQNAGLVYIA